MYYHLYDIDGFYCGMTETKPEHNRWTNTAPTFTNIKEKWNGSAWIEGATPQEISEASKEPVPTLISRMGLKIQLRIRNIDISEVEKTIRELPDWMMSQLEKDLAVIKFNDAAYYDRYNADYNLVATMMGLSQTDLDEIHINGNKL
ncbi:hypothetical protein [Flavobacterium sp.]|uniref:hypothetical protein n=1 Tax=Flavobacterium sp. TaxID=239 RepID=UPI0026214086|nr:hypothetical protein [Flavobacterium sp.]